MKKIIIFVLFLMFLLIGSYILKDNKILKPLINASNKSIIEKPMNDIEITHVIYQKEIEPGRPISIKVEIKNHFDKQISGIVLKGTIKNSKGTILGSSENNLMLFPLDEITEMVNLGSFSCQENYSISDRKSVV